MSVRIFAINLLNKSKLKRTIITNCDTPRDRRLPRGVHLYPKPNLLRDKEKSLPT